MNHMTVMDIIAYYLSEYDMRAFEALGYTSQTQGFNAIAAIFERKPSYLRRLRDEYDVVTNSSRNGQRNRPPRLRIVDTKAYLSSFSFSELTDMVKAFISAKSPSEYTEEDPSDASDSSGSLLSETEIEAILNFKDPGAIIKVKTEDRKIRVYNTSIIRQLKKLYDGQCQLCGEKPFPDYDIDICEAHHISYFSESQNNDASNIIIICPNHHRLIHKTNPCFDSGNRTFQFSDGTTMDLKLDLHLM